MAEKFKTKSIFADSAPAYYEAGLPVIPLKEGQKRPELNDWSVWCRELPPKELQEQWVSQYPNGNIGIALGKQSGLIAVDIDSRDEKVIRAIRAALPESPWVRIGDKGMMLIYKYNPRIKNRNIKEAGTDAMIFEIKSDGTQIVLPPSIHPDTQRPYVSNKHMLDTTDSLRPLPEDVEQVVRDALEGIVDLATRGKGYSPTKYISQGSRDTSMTSMGGRYAAEVRIGNITVAEGISAIEDWCAKNVEKVVGDEIDVEKGVRNFLNFLKRDVVELNRILPVGWDKGLSDQRKQDYGLDFDEQYKEWDYDKVIEYLQDALTNTAKGSMERREAIDFIIEKVAKSPSMDDITTERVLTYLSKYAEDLKAPAYKKQIKAINAQNGIEGANHSEIAAQVVAQYNERFGTLRHHEDDFWRWTGDHWTVEPSDQIWHIIATEYGDLQAARKAADHKGILQVMKRILPQGISDKKYIGVNFINGFVDEDLKLHPHKPEHGMTYVLPYRYDPVIAGKFPLFNRLLNGYWSKDKDYAEKIKALQEAMGVTLMGVAPEHAKCFLLYGKPSSGKSQLLEIIAGLVPPEAQTSVNPEQFEKSHYIASLNHKLLNIAGELSNKRMIPSNIFKTLISGEILSADAKYKANISFRCKAAHWFASNHLPKSSDTSESFYRRWLIFDFTRVIPDDEKVLDFGRVIIEEEMEAIISWALQSYKWMKGKVTYTIPESHKTRVLEMGYENSSVRYFLNSCKDLAYGSNFSCGVEELHSKYFVFCNKDGLRPVSLKKFILEVSMISDDYRKFGIQGQGLATIYCGVRVR